MWLPESVMGEDLADTRTRALSLRTSDWFIRHPFKGSGRLKDQLCRLLLPRPAGPTVVHTLYDFDILVDPVADRGLEEALYYCGTYEAGTLWVLQQCLRPGDVFIDVGANIGLMSLVAARAVGARGHVYACEPDPGTYAILKQNIEINQLRNLSTFPIALGASAATLALHRTIDRNRGSASLAAPGEAGDGGTLVPVKTLDEFCREHAISNVRMLKIDVEGWELPVLQGAQKLLEGAPAPVKEAQSPIVCVEYSRRNATESNELLDVYRFITSLRRYDIFRLKRGKESISKLVQVHSQADLPYHDNLFCFPND